MGNVKMLEIRERYDADGVVTHLQLLDSGKQRSQNV